MTKSKMKLRVIAIVSFALLFVLALSLAIGVLPVSQKASAASTYQPSSIFSAGTGGEVGSNKPDSGASDTATYWMQFTLQDGGSVHYRRDLALRWFEKQEEPAESQPTAQEAAERANPAEKKYFSMKFSFPEVRFETFEIAFESAEENITKDALATNKLFFEKKDGKLYVSVRDAYYEEGDTPATTEITDLAADLFFAFSEENCSIGEFAVSMQVGEGAPVEIGKFSNIGGYFLEYRSSAATTPQTPMTFTAKLPAAASGQTDPQLVLMKELNGQTFEIGTDNRITDNAKPVLVLNEAVYSFRLGQRFSLTYEAIDVCDDSVDPTRSYYMLTKDQDGKYHKPSETGSKDYKTLNTSTFFMPTSDEGEEKAYVSIRFKLNDGTFTDYYVYLTWYAANDGEGIVETLGDEDYTARYVCDVCGKEYTEAEYSALTDDSVCTGKTGSGDSEKACTGKKADIKLVESNRFDYIVVDLKAEGPEYVGVTAVEAEKDAEDTVTNPAHNEVSEAGKAAETAYQEAVTAAAKKISAGDGSYFYLPSLRGLIESKYADYRNLRFSIYYYKKGTAAGSTATSSTGLRYNNLRFEVDEVGDYRFRVIAEDAAKNTMKYYDEDGELVTVTASNVWDIEGIPEFTFSIDYNGPTVEKPGSQKEGTRDKTYTIEDFDIIAIAGYEADYTLYRFEAPEGHQSVTYTGLVELVDDDLALEKAENQWIKDSLKEIDVYNPEISKQDKELWDKTDNDYAWNPESSLSFCPQEMGTYFLRVDITDSYLINTTTSAYQVILVRNPTDTIKGDTPWLKNNIAAIVLFSLSGVFFVALVVLFVVKPSEKTVEEVDLESLKGKKKKNKKE